MEKIPESVIRRLPKYYRYLSEIKNTKDKISSEEMGRALNLTASQIRRDFSCFGGFGQQGYGYSAKKLLEELNKIFGKDKKSKAVIVGAGNIGLALNNYAGFALEGIEILALFDVETNKAEHENVKIFPIENIAGFVRENNVEIGIIATPKEAAQKTADILTSAGVTGIWNFAPTDIESCASVENVHLSDSLNFLKFIISN